MNWNYDYLILILLIGIAILCGSLLLQSGVLAALASILSVLAP